MADYYANFDLTTGNDDGSDYDNAFKSVSSMCAAYGTTYGPGDRVLMRGSETFTADITDFADVNGTSTSRVEFIGVNSSWVNDGNSSNVIWDLGTYVLYFYNSGHLNFENITLVRSDGGSGIVWAQTGGASYSQVFNNIYFDTCYPNNYYGTAESHCFYKCRVDNADAGFMARSAWLVAFCVANNCADYGFYFRDTKTSIGNVSCNNNTGYSLIYDMPVMINNIAYNNTTCGIDLNTYQLNNLIGHRSYNNGESISEETTSDVVYYIGNYFDDIGGDSPLFTGVVDFLCEYNGTDTDGGFNDPTNGDFNLTSSATMRDIPITLPS